MAFDRGPRPRAPRWSPSVALLVLALRRWHISAPSRRAAPGSSSLVLAVPCTSPPSGSTTPPRSPCSPGAPWSSWRCRSAPPLPSVAALDLLPVPMALLRDGTAHPGPRPAPADRAGPGVRAPLGTFVSHLVEQNEERAAMIAELPPAAPRSPASPTRPASPPNGPASPPRSTTPSPRASPASSPSPRRPSRSPADPPAAARRLDQVVGTARDNLAEARALVAALAPADLHNSGLGDAVRRQLSRLAAETGVRTACTSAPAPRPCRPRCRWCCCARPRRPSPTSAGTLPGHRGGALRAPAPRWC